MIEKKFKSVTVTSDGDVLKGEKSIVRSLPTGYKVVSFDGMQAYVHRLVWETFFGEIPQGWEVDHINGDIADNRTENLRCVTPKQNRSNPRTVERYRESNKGKGKYTVKPVEQIDQEGEVVNVFRCIADVRDCGFSPSAVSQCCRGILKTHQGFVWKKVS